MLYLHHPPTEFLLSSASIHILSTSIQHVPEIHIVKMSSPSHTFLTLIPATHRVATISPFTSPIDGAVADESLVPAFQKTRRSSSSASAESNSVVEEPAGIVESPVVGVKTPVEPGAVHRFLKLGN